MQGIFHAPLTHTRALFFAFFSNTCLVSAGFNTASSSDRDDPRIFLGLKLSISGFFCVGIILGDQNNLKIRESSYGSRLRRFLWKFLWLGNSAWGFWGVKFCFSSPLLREVFLRVFQFPSLLKTQHFQIPIRNKLQLRVK